VIERAREADAKPTTAMSPRTKAAVTQGTSTCIDWAEEIMQLYAFMFVRSATCSCLEDMQGSSQE
jgi:hypothetical protein